MTFGDRALVVVVVLLMAVNLIATLNQEEPHFIVGPCGPLTRLELTPHELRLEVGEDRTVHVETFSYDTPLVPAFVDAAIVSGSDVAELRRYHAPFLTIRGLQVGEAVLQVAVGEELLERLPIVVTGRGRE